MNTNRNLKAADSQIDYSSVNLRLTHLKLITWVTNTESEGENGTPEIYNGLLPSITRRIIAIIAITNST